MIDFEVPPDLEDLRDRVARFVRDEVLPAEADASEETFDSVVTELRKKAREAGLWTPHLPPEWGGMGLGALGMALVSQELGASALASYALNVMAPDEGNMHLLLEAGTPEQKDRYLRRLADADIRSCFAMTEREVGSSDPRQLKASAVLDGDEWVINGEKWFTSAGRVADLLFVMCTNGMFVVPRETPGVEIMPEPRNHNHIIYRDVRVPLDHVLGPEDGAKVLAQRRLGDGRIHHAMRTIAQCKLAFDMMCERALSR